MSKVDQFDNSIHHGITKGQSALPKVDRSLIAGALNIFLIITIKSEARNFILQPLVQTTNEYGLTDSTDLTLPSFKPIAELI